MLNTMTMKTFTIEANTFLTRKIEGFYNTDFGGSYYPGNPNYLYQIKNDPHHNWTTLHIKQSQNQLRSVIQDDLPKIASQLGINNLTVCVVPRAKALHTYRPDQLLFKKTVQEVIHSLDHLFIDGIDSIVRVKDTLTTHLTRPIANYDNNGPDVYKGISQDTCQFDIQNIRGKDILLIDDVYTKTANVAEDMIQTLLNFGAKNVYFYCIGNTIKKN